MKAKAGRQQNLPGGLSPADVAPADDEALDRFLEDTRAYLKILDGSSRLKIDLAYDGLDISL
jgi:hypothetical protein